MSESISDCFPVDVKVQWDYSAATSHRTIVSRLMDGSSQRRGIYRAAGWKKLAFSTEALSEADAQALDDFLVLHRGGLVPFYFFLPDSGQAYKGESIGTTTGSAGQAITTIFRESSISDVKIDGSSIGSGYTFTPNFGTYGEDKVTITASHTAGKPITIDVTGRKRLGVRNMLDDVKRIPFQRASPPRWVFPLQLEQVT